MPHYNIYDRISFRKENKHDKLYGITLHGTIIKIDCKEAFCVVDTDYGLDIIKFNEVNK